MGKQNDKNKFTVVAVSSVLILGVIVAVVFVFVFQGEQTSELAAVKKRACEVENPTIVDMSICAKADCTFDPSICAQECPFDYMSDENGCPSSCECADSGVFQGDIQFEDTEVADMAEKYGYIDTETDFEIFFGAGISYQNIWNQYPSNGRFKVAYELDAKARSLPKLMQELKESIARISKDTCIDFVPRTNEREYFEIVSDTTPGCRAPMGKLKHYKKVQKVWLPKGCERGRTTQHELTHLLGFAHQHTRADRDAYITVMKENIISSGQHNFKRLKKSETRDTEVEFEFGSIMMYSSTSFIKDIGLNSYVIRKTGGEYKPAFESRYSDGDIADINLVYDCWKPNRHDAGWSSWGLWTPCDETCGTGEIHRYRKCEDSAKKYTAGCDGDARESKPCTVPNTPCKDAQEGQWSEWAPWTPCTGPCGNGRQTRRRHCSVPNGCGIQQSHYDKICYPPCGGSAASAWSSTSSVGSSISGAWPSISGTSGGYSPGGWSPSTGTSGGYSPGGWSPTTGTSGGYSPGGWSPTTGTSGGYSPGGWSPTTGTSGGYGQISPSTGTSGGWSPTTGTSGGYGQVSPSTGTSGGWSPTTGTSGGYGQVSPSTGTSGGWSPTTGTSGGYGQVSPSTGTSGGWSPTTGTSGATAGTNQGQWPSSTGGSSFSQASALFESSETRVAGDLCSGKGEGIFGDFDADGKTDILCVGASGSIVSGRVDRQGKLNKKLLSDKISCAGGMKHIGDFNGDGMDDLLCQDTAAKKITITLAESASKFGMVMDGGNFCTDTMDRLLLIDMDGNKAMDLLCQMKDKRVEIRLNKFL